VRREQPKAQAGQLDPRQNCGSLLPINYSFLADYQFLIGRCRTSARIRIRYGNVRCRGKEISEIFSKDEIIERERSAVSFH
jgi:hypothetical protein